MNSATFEISPGHGALPLAFGMPRAYVHRLLGSPLVYHPLPRIDDDWAHINVQYDRNGLVCHIGLTPGPYRLTIFDAVLWAPDALLDPNPTLLRYDPSPYETLGFLVFASIGVTTTGFHDDKPDDRALTVFPLGAWDRYLTDAGRPHLETRRASPQQP